MPLVLQTPPRPTSTLVTDDDLQIVYNRNWRALSRRRFSGYKDDVHSTASMNDSAQFTSRGTGIEYLVEERAASDKVDVYLDGAFQQNVDPSTKDLPRLSRVAAFRIEGLRDREHTIRIVNKSSAEIVLEAVRIYGRG
jgi:hypothetical protein